MILDIRNANGNFGSDRSERPDLDQESAPKQARIPGRRIRHALFSIAGHAPNREETSHELGD